MPRVRAPLQGAPPAVNIVQESSLTHDTHLPPPTHRPSHLSPTLPTCSPRMPPGHPLERTSGGTDWTPRISSRPPWCVLALRASAPRGTCFGCVMAAGIVRGQVARIHLRSTPGPAPAHTAATLSRAQSVLSQMARCEHPSRSRNDLPGPGLVMPTATTRGLGATCRDMDVPHGSPAPDSTDNSWIVAPEPRGVAALWRIQPSLKQTVLCQFQPERAGIVPRHVPAAGSGRNQPAVSTQRT